MFLHKAVNAVLAEYGQRAAQLKKWLVLTIANAADIQEGLMVSVRFPDDYKLRTEAELIALLKQAREANAPSEVVNNIELDNQISI